MREYKAQELGHSILLDAGSGEKVYPYIRSESGDKTMLLVGPQHGRSYVVAKNDDGRYIVSKGNGLSYSRSIFLDTMESAFDIWGCLRESDARRDFLQGQDIASLGIKTNKMQYVLSIDNMDIPLLNGTTIHPILLQYSVECPYRISDASVMGKDLILNEASKWISPHREFSNKGQYHETAAEILISNLRIMHENNVLHNAISTQNYTWALELLDFELSSSPKHPYDREDYQRHVPTLMPREIMYTYQIIVEIAYCLGEAIDFYRIDQIFLENGFNLNKYNIKTTSRL